MEYAAFKKKLGQAGLSVSEFAGIMQINCNSVSNYCSKGFVPVHLAVAATLMSEMAYRGIDFKSVLIDTRAQASHPSPIASSKATSL